MNPFSEKVASLLPNQYHKHALEVDSHLRVIGAPLGTVYALGDCATVETRLVDHLLEMVERCDENKDGVIEEREFEMMMKVCSGFFLGVGERIAETLRVRRLLTASSRRHKSTSTRFGELS